VRAIKVHDGQVVRSGDVLIELDTTITAAELGHWKSDLLAAQLEVARAKAALTRKDDPLAAFIPPADASLSDSGRKSLSSRAGPLRPMLLFLS
jgi:hemolysin D